MSDETKATKVYLLVEATVNGFPGGDHAAIASACVSNAIISDSRNRVGDGRYAFTWMTGQVVLNLASVLPGDIQDILERDEMRGVPLHEQLRQAIAKDRKRPAKERFQELVDRGAINKKGKVLLKGPWEPNEEEYDFD